ncbi:MAG: DNA repair protein RecO [Candidatus Wolfebacteria bacterium]|nr:DNA repair protein RecO [Candidatus Wolfebacteria bacterium]
MQEYLTDAIVLDIEDSGDSDLLVHLYTPDFGKITARAKSARKITSKLAGHLQPLNVSKVRIVEKNGSQIVDAIKIRQLPRSKESLALLKFIKEMVYEFQPDKKFWLAVKKSFEDMKSLPAGRQGKKISYKSLLEILGFSPEFAGCSKCGGKKLKFFLMKDHIFFCEKCAADSKIPKIEVVLI